MDSRKKKVVWVLSLASLVLVWRVYALVTKYAPSKAKGDAPVAGVTAHQRDAGATGAASDDELQSTWQQQEAVANEPWGRDPFADVPAAIRISQSPEGPKDIADEAPPAPPALSFTGASLCNGRWLAVVRGRIVRQGDVIDEQYKVTDISKWTITVTRGRWAFKYDLGSAEVVIRPTPEE